MTDNEESFNAWVLHGDAPQMQERCPTCRRFAVYPYVLQEFALEGLHQRYVRLGCSNCLTWVSDPIEISYPPAD